jgi:ABC-type Fe3+ transport system permease subunit
MSAYAVMLLAYAQVAATLTGFIGVVFVFGERSRRLGNDRSSALSHLIHASLNAMFLSLFAALLLVYLAAEEHIAWQICNALSGYIQLVGGG